MQTFVQRLGHWLGQVDKLFTKSEEVLLALLIVGMVLLAALQVVLRNVWDVAIDWADVTLQNVTVLLALLGAAVATSEGRHLTIDVASRSLTGRKKALAKVAIGLLSTGISLVLAAGGWANVTTNYRSFVENVPSGWTVAHELKVQFLEGTIPQWLTQLMFPIGFGLIAFHFAVRLLRDTGWLITNQCWEAEGSAGLEGDAMLDEMLRSADDDLASGGAPSGSSGGGTGGAK